MTEDEWLILRIQNFNSESAKDKLIRKYYDNIYAYAYRKTLNTEDSLDLTQEILIKTIHALPCFDRRKASFKTWLYSIASNCINDHFRSYKISEELIDNLPGEDSFEEVIENKAMALKIMDYLKQQDSASCKVVELKIFAGLTFDEIGKMLNLSPNTVKTKYYTAIKKCRKEFAAYEN